MRDSIDGRISRTPASIGAPGSLGVPCKSSRSAAKSKALLGVDPQDQFPELTNCHELREPPEEETSLLLWPASPVAASGCNPGNPSRSATCLAVPFCRLPGLTLVGLLYFAFAVLPLVAMVTSAARRGAMRACWAVIHFGEPLLCCVNEDARPQQYRRARYPPPFRRTLSSPLHRNLKVPHFCRIPREILAIAKQIYTREYPTRQHVCS